MADLKNFVVLLTLFFVVFLSEPFNVISSQTTNIDQYTLNNQQADEHKDVQGNSAVKDVHIIFMNHLDVGYNGVKPQVGFINVVLNTYFTQHFPRAVNLTKELRSKGYGETFIYTTHPWLVKLYLDCPHLVLSGITLQCPTETEKSDFVKALKDGTITYHAGPMNMQPENMNKMLFELSLNLSVNLDTMLDIQRRFSTLSQRDVPGMTKSVIPSLVQKGIAAVSVGVNDGTSPPAVPRIFTWKYDDMNQVIAMWHPGGYPDNPGPNPHNPGGLSRKDCVVIDKFDQALCFAFRTDNSGPPTNIQEILGYYEIIRAEFPGANLFASTFEKYVETLQPIKSQLPVVTNEIGDTWISGIASDPRKMAEYRAVTHTLTECIEKGYCNTTDSRIQNAVFYLMKAGEHTWGLPDVGDTYNWNNHAFNVARQGHTYLDCEQAWREQREFTHLAIAALGDHAVREDMTEALRELIPARPNLEGFNIVDGSSYYNSSDGVVIQFNTDGSIKYLYDPYNDENWAKSTVFGRFTYQTYDEGDFNATNQQYHYNWKIFTKPNLTRNSYAKSSIWETKLETLYKSKDEDFSFLAKIVMADPAATLAFGAPAEVWIQYDYNKQQPGFNVTLQWFDKTPTRLPESLMFYFNPLPPVPLSQTGDNIDERGGQKVNKPSSRVDSKVSNEDGDSTLKFVKLEKLDTNIQEKIYSWKVKKLGRFIDPSNVVKNGSQYLHAIDSEVQYTTPNGAGLRLVSRDVPLVSVGTIQKSPSPFPVPLDPIEQGQITAAAFNMYNNMWNTNYVLWYPYKGDPSDKDFKARFYIGFNRA